MKKRCYCLPFLFIDGWSLALSSVRSGRTLERLDANISTRRVFLSVTSAVLSSFINKEEVDALEARNEIVCGTGFFTNIAQYKCTEIGDISDEGKVKTVNADEVKSMESLLGKMGITDSTDGVGGKGTKATTQEMTAPDIVRFLPPEIRDSSTHTNK